MNSTIIVSDQETYICEIKRPFKTAEIKFKQSGNLIAEVHRLGAFTIQNDMPVKISLSQELMEFYGAVNKALRYGYADYHNFLQREAERSERRAFNSMG